MQKTYVLCYVKGYVLCYVEGYVMIQCDTLGASLNSLNIND